MTVTIEDPSAGQRSRRVGDVVELLSSMRFAISLLSVICVASVIGTVLKQHEPMNNYVNQFGPFWSEVFAKFDLYSVYSAWWFLLILAFLVISTSLCIVRNTPKILSDLKAYKENIRAQSLKAFGHRAEAELDGEAQTQAHRIGQLLVDSGWKVKLQQRTTAAGEGWMVAAKIGTANKLGYLAAHSAIVLVCIGGLLDGDLVVRAQMWFNGKSVFTGGGLISDVPEQHRLPLSNPTFRGNLLVTEGGNAHVVILSQPTGVLLQELPFSVELKKFVVDYYSTGMPKLFASDIVIHDKATGETTPARVEVNHPVKYKGIEIFQSSFDDGGSSIQLKAFPMTANVKSFTVDGVVGGSTQLTNGAEQLTLEFTGLRVINVENFASSAGSGTDVRAVDLRHSIESRLGAANKTPTEKVLRNIGPSFSYKLRDSAGQASEFNNYMLPVDVDGTRLFLLGQRDGVGMPFRYLRIPADENDSLDGWFRLRAALSDPALRSKAVQRYAASAVDPARADLVQALAASADRAISLFAGTDSFIKQPGSGNQPLGGLQAVSQFMEANVPESDREKASEVLVRILNGVLLELNQLAREKAGLQPAPQDQATRAFMTQSVLSLSDAFFYTAPMTFMMQDFKQVQASVFQVSRAPGKTIVYIGCFFLIVGVFAMLYIRERRLWVWLVAHPQKNTLATESSGTHATMALSTNRKTMEADKEFDVLKSRLLLLSE